MNPNEPYDSANKPAAVPTPPVSSSSSDAAAMQAIEALEAESNGLSDPISPTPSPVTPTMPETPPVVPSTPTSAPVIESVDSSPALPPSEPTVPATDTPAGDIAKSLSNEPAAANATTDFKPFAIANKPSHKLRTILIVVILLIVLGAGGYFGWQYYQTMNTPTPTVQAPPADTTEEEETPVDTNASVNNSIKDMNAQLSTMDDAEYNDTTLSDSTLYN